MAMLELLAVAVVIFAALMGIVWLVSYRGSRAIHRVKKQYEEDLARERRPSSRRLP